MSDDKPSGTKVGDSLDHTELNFLIDNRKYVRGKSTRLCNRVKGEYHTYDTVQCEQLIEELTDVKNKLASLNNKVSCKLWQFESDRKKLDGEIESCYTYEENITEVIRRLRVHRNSRTALDPNTSQSNQTFDNSVHSVNLVPNLRSNPNLPKLPQVPLPSYSHAKNEIIEEFFSSFETIIGRSSLTDLEKFSYLENQLSGEPLHLVKSLQGVEKCYTEAKALLLKAFSSPTLRKFDVIKRLLALELNYPSDTYKFIGEMRSIIALFTSSSVDIDSILQFFIWKALPHEFKDQFVHITNKNHPNLIEIQDNVFEAAERYINMSKSHALTGPSLAELNLNSHGLAVNIDKSVDRKKSCILCCKDHHISMCSKYPSAKDKTDQLRHLSRCVRCAGPNHNANSCKFKFYKSCNSCNGKNHFTYLCLSKKKCESKLKTDGVVHVNANCLTLGSGHSVDIILPTFTLNLNNDTKIRALKDSGCTNCFIRRSVAKDCNFRVLQHVKVNINGMNVNQLYDSELVEVKFKVANAIKTVSAITIDNLSIKLNVPKLGSVVTAFVQKGYRMADETLDSYTSQIDNIDFILGSDYSYVLPGNDIVFGTNDSSMYTITALGILLTGSGERLVKNLQYLESRKSECKMATIHSSEFNTDPNLILSQIVEDHICSEGEFLSNDILQVEARICHSDIVSFDHGSINDDTMYLPGRVLENICCDVLGHEEVTEDQFDEQDQSLINGTLNNITVTTNGRISVPLLWNLKTAPYLTDNYSLASAVLKSNFKKYANHSEILLMMDATIKDQLAKGVVGKIDDLDSLRAHKNYSFLAHMPIIKLDRSTTKCRIVYLSNLSDKKGKGPHISHNTAMLSGPCLNRNLLTAITQMRCEAYLLIFDLVKAFLQIEVPPHDQYKLCFLWYRDVEKSDFTEIAYHFKRLPFGLKCSPFLLMISLYYILIVDTDSDSHKMKTLKRKIWNLFYVDNGAVISSDSEYLTWAYQQLKEIFGKYNFNVQQYVTNEPNLQKLLNESDDSAKMDSCVKLLGMQWNTKCDLLGIPSVTLDKTANTKRTVLQSIASNFDLMGLSLPILNRARLFMQKLQCQKALGWDEELSVEQRRVWVNIANQVNNTPAIAVERFVGDMHDSYELAAFTDSSQDIYGCAVYLVNNSRNCISFLFAKNRLVSKNLGTKSIPSLELKAVELGVQVLLNTFISLTGEDCVCPLKINSLNVYCDSLVALNWIQKHSLKFDKTNKLSVFVKNRLNKIAFLCDTHSVDFHFCAGKQNPADYVTRAVSHKILTKTNFYSGLSFTEMDEMRSDKSITFTIPNVQLQPEISCEGKVSNVENANSERSPLYNLERSSSLQKALKVSKFVLKFINNLKIKVNERNSNQNLPTLHSGELSNEALMLLIRQDQTIHFQGIFTYFNSKIKTLKKIPPLVSQMNIFCDEVGILRVKCKLKSWRQNITYPILLAKTSCFTKLLIRKTHESLSHAGVYSVLSELRKSYWIPSGFSIVKKYIRECIICKRFNNRSIKLNQNSYRDFRLEPSQIAYRDIFMDYIGPLYVTVNGSKAKCYLLIITCLWSRAVNLQICTDMSVERFLRAFQLHIYSFGVPSRVYSDLGSNLVASSKVITDYLNDETTKTFFANHNMEPVSFQQFYKGCSKLGSLVESCVKIVKKLIYGSIRNLVLNIDDFQFLVSQIVHLINRRPVAFKEALRDCSVLHEVPGAITPEILLHGRELVSINIIPQVRGGDEDPDWSNVTDSVEHIRTSFLKLNKARFLLHKLYNEQFIPLLISQAVNVKDRYKPSPHKSLMKGDIVLLKEPFLKPSSYPMALVINTVVNDIGEVTAIEVRKGRSREIVKRHAESVIPLLSPEIPATELTVSQDQISCSDRSVPANNPRPRRTAAIDCEAVIRDLISKHYV